MGEAAIEEHPLGDGGLAGVDVGDDADVSQLWMSCGMTGVDLGAKGVNDRAAAAEVNGRGGYANGDPPHDGVRDRPCHCFAEAVKRLALRHYFDEAVAHNASSQRESMRRCRLDRSYQAKWAKALLASAMRWTFSRLV